MESNKRMVHFWWAVNCWREFRARFLLGTGTCWMENQAPTAWIVVDVLLWFSCFWFGVKREPAWQLQVVDPTGSVCVESSSCS